MPRPMVHSEVVELIKAACHSGCWEHVERRVLQAASHAFASWHDPPEWTELTGGVAGYQELQAFDRMKTAVDDAVQHGGVAPNASRLATYADAYDYMLQHGGHVEVDKSSYARHFRDVIVVECIRVAGTHTDLHSFAQVLNTAFKRNLRNEAQMNTKADGRDKSVWSMMLGSYHQLFTGAADKFESGATRGRKNKPPRPARRKQQSSSRAPIAWSTGARSPPCVPERRSPSTSTASQIYVDSFAHSQRQFSRPRQEQRGSDADGRSFPCELSSILKRLEDLERREQQWHVERIMLLARVAKLEEASYVYQ